MSDSRIYAVHGCVKCEDGTIERVSDDVAQFWTLYLVAQVTDIYGRPLYYTEDHAVLDFQTRKLAEEYARSHGQIEERP